MERIAYDEFSMFHENAEEFDIPYDGPPAVRRESVDLGDGRRSHRFTSKGSYPACDSWSPR